MRCHGRPSLANQHHRDTSHVCIVPLPLTGTFGKWVLNGLTAVIVPTIDGSPSDRWMARRAHVALWRRRTRPAETTVADLKTQPIGDDVEAFVAAIPDERRRADARAVSDLLARVTGACLDHGRA
jgi:hypothetical protein